MSQLALHLNLGSVINLPAWSDYKATTIAEQILLLKKYGFTGVQAGSTEGYQGTAVHVSGYGQILTPEDAHTMIPQWKQAGYVCTTVHVGTGLESDAEGDTLLKSITEAVKRYEYPVFVETHRATITQDIIRTVGFAERNPDLRFNLDFSHYYTGQEMRYGNWDHKLATLSPILERARYIHGRIGNSCHMQIAVANDEAPKVVNDFKEVWSLAFAGYLTSKEHALPFIFAPELLPPPYAAVHPTDGQQREYSDRWLESLYLCQCMQEVATQLTVKA